MTAASGPLSSAVASVSITLTGYATGDTATIVLGAIAGALWALSASDTKSRTDASLLVIKLVATALALTGFLAYLLEQSGDVPAAKALAPIAFFVAAVGSRWPAVISALVDGLVGLIAAGFKALAHRLGVSPGDDK